MQKHPRNSRFDPLPLPRGPSRCFPYRRHSRDSGRGSGCFPGRGAFSLARDPLGERLGPGPPRPWGPGALRGETSDLSPREGCTYCCFCLDMLLVSKSGHQPQKTTPLFRGTFCLGKGLRAFRALAPHERLPEVPVVPREKPHTGAAARENPRDAPVIVR